jgi:hypothetical protein
MYPAAICLGRREAAALRPGLTGDTESTQDTTVRLLGAPMSAEPDLIPGTGLVVIEAG